ncbi:MAG: PIG-L family deacetylase [Rubrivivax sp.]
MNGATPAPESDWLEWLAAVSAPSFGLRHWLPEGSRAVVVAPHPDDEVIGCGALLAAHARRGGRTLVLAVTDGEASHPHSSHWTAATLAAERCRERLQGLSRLGLPGDVVQRLGLPDGEVGPHAARLQSMLSQHLRPGDVLLSTWRHDGHPDHEATGAAVAAAAADCGLRHIETPVWMWHWAQPGDDRVPWRQLAGFAADGVDVQAKQQALAAHRSQCQADANSVPPVLDAAMVQRAGRKVEWLIESA